MFFGLSTSFAGMNQCSRKKSGKVSMRKIVAWVSGVVLLLSVGNASAVWWTVLEDDFSAPPTEWTYTGVSNALGAALFRYDAAHQRVAAEWDQSNHFEGWPNDPYVIENSHFARALPRRLTDRNTFRVRGTLRIVSSSIPDTTEFYQIANIGLYGLDRMGPDRTQADDWSGNTVLLRDAGDFVEFSYFINNRSYGFNPNITAMIGGTVTNDMDYVYVTGSGQDTNWYHSTDMGEDAYLPVDTDIFLELTYFGAAEGELSRRANISLYTDEARTNLLEVNGVPLYYWTQALPETESFEVTHVAFFNYAAANWGGANAEGAGSWDDVFVDVNLSEGSILSAGHPPALSLQWIAEPGKNYAVVSQDDLMSGSRITEAIVTAVGNTAGWTNSTSHAGPSFFFVEPVE